MNTYKSIPNLVWAFTSILFLSVLLSCQPDREAVELKLIETSDVHGAAFPVELMSGDSTSNSLAHVYNYVSQQREAYGDRLILLDNGDLIQGDPSSYYYNFMDTASPHLYAEILNFMGYDAATVGNHDIEAGHPVYDRLVKQFNFPWLAANAVREDDGSPYFQPYTIIMKEGIRIAVLGLITPAIPRWLPENLWDGMYFEPLVKSAQKWVDVIQREEAPDMIIGLFHAGADTVDRPAGTDPYNENASSEVARNVEGFDLILIGHDHHGWNMKLPSPSGDSVLILGPTSKARNVATATLRFEPSEDGWDLSVSGEIVEMEKLEPSEDFLDQFSGQALQVASFVLDTTGVLSNKLEAWRTVFGPAAFTGLIHQLQLDLSGADISFTAPLSTRFNLEPGPVLVGDLFKLYRYENMLYRMKLTGREIDAYLEFAVNGWFNVMNKPEDYLIDYELDETGDPVMRYGRPVTRNIYYNFSRAAGIKYLVDLSAKRNERILIHDLNNGRPFYPDSVYLVAVNSYRGSGGGGHLTQGAGIPDSVLSSRIDWTSDHDLRYHLMEWLRSNSPIEAKVYGDWKIIPVEWYEAGTERERNLWE